MLKMTFAEAAAACGGKYSGPEDMLASPLASVFTDSRSACENGLFVCIKGERADGHDFAAAAAEKGAVCLAERELDVPNILVENTVEALQKIAAAYRSSLGVKIVGITGSVGKTTCKEIVASVLAQKYRVHKTLGNFNNEIGLPLTLLAMTAETEAAVIEMGMSDFCEMRLLSSIARPDICVMTNIGFSHMEILGSQQGILQAKCEIFEYMAPDAPAFLNGDDALLRTVKRENLRFFGFGEDNDIRVTDFTDFGLKGSGGVITAGGKNIPFRLTIPGRHLAGSAAAAAGVGLELGLTTEEISAGLSAAETISGRVNIVERGGLLIIDDCYNAAPASMKAGIDLLVSSGRPTVAILGDMGELGPAAPVLHAEVGAYAAKAGVGIVLAVGPLSESIARACAENGGKAAHFKDIDSLLLELDAYLPEGCAVLVKASHFMGFPRVVEALGK